MSRSTFREPAGAVCWQKQLRDRYNGEGVPPVPTLDVKRAIVRPVSRETAEQIIFKYEWLGTLAAGTQRHYGIFFGHFCAGVTTFASAGAIPVLMKTFRLSANELTYLGRGACVHWAPPNTNSRLIAWSCRFERARGMKLAIAFTDTDAGEVGTVYQAAGWIYLGRGSAHWSQWVSPRGKLWSRNSMTKRRGVLDVSTRELSAALIEQGWRKQSTNPKGRYVCILDRSDSALVRRVESMRQPYPKRERSRENAAAGPPVEGGGIPTRSLQRSATT